MIRITVYFDCNVNDMPYLFVEQLAGSGMSMTARICITLIFPIINPTPFTIQCTAALWKRLLSWWLFTDLLHPENVFSSVLCRDGDLIYWSFEPWKYRFRSCSVSLLADWSALDQTKPVGFFSMSAYLSSDVTLLSRSSQTWWLLVEWCLVGAAHT